MLSASITAGLAGTLRASTSPALCLEIQSTHLECFGILNYTFLPHSAQCGAHPGDRNAPGESQGDDRSQQDHPTGSSHRIIPHDHPSRIIPAGSSPVLQSQLWAALRQCGAQMMGLAFVPSQTLGQLLLFHKGPLKARRGQEREVVTIREETVQWLLVLSWQPRAPGAHRVYFPLAPLSGELAHAQGRLGEVRPGTPWL